MKFFISILLAANIANGYSQTDTLFFDKSWKTSGRDSAAFYRTISEKNNLFEISDFYINNILQMKGKSSNRDSLFRQGDFFYYNDKGNLIQTITYRDNVKQGKSTSYFDDGTIKRITNFIDDNFNGETMYYNKKGVLIGKGLAKDNYWYGKWESYNDDGSFSSYLYYDDNYKFDEIGVSVSTPDHIWIYFDKTENDSTVKYLCRATNSKSDALAKYPDAPDVYVIIPKKPEVKPGKESQFDYKFDIKDSSINISNVDSVNHVTRNDKFYTYFYIDLNAGSLKFKIIIVVIENKFDFYEPVIREFISNLSLGKAK